MIIENRDEYDYVLKVLAAAEGGWTEHLLLNSLLTMLTKAKEAYEAKHRPLPQEDLLLQQAATVHFLRFGVTPCNMPIPPGSWPEGVKWSDNWSKVDCRVCLRMRE